MPNKRKLDVMVAQPAFKQSAKPLEKLRLDDSKAVVVGGGGAVNGRHEVVEISSDDHDDGEEQEEEEEEEEEEDGTEDEKSLSDYEENEGDDDDDDVSMGDAEAEHDEDGDGQPSFGDLVRVNAAAEAVDVAGALGGDSNAMVEEKTNGDGNPSVVPITSGQSLGTVLTQALRTNDAAMLETCLQETNLQTVRLTLQRLPSPLAATLLHHLASRLHRRPGRAGSLIVWIQWTLVTHGGYLAAQPALVEKLTDVHRVIDERSRALPALLLLKGRLDMLDSQMKLRKSMANQRRNLDDEGNEEAVIYVEGEDGDEEDAEEDKVTKPRKTDGRRLDFSGRSSEISGDVPNINGGAHPESDEEEAEEEEEEEEEEDSDSDGGGSNLVDDEAEETGNEDSEDEDEVDFEDQDEVEEEEDS